MDSRRNRDRLEPFKRPQRTPLWPLTAKLSSSAWLVLRKITILSYISRKARVQEPDIFLPVYSSRKASSEFKVEILCNLHADKRRCYCNYRFRWKFKFLRSLPQNVYFGGSKQKSVAANSMSYPCQKEITICSTVRMPILCIIRIETFRVIVN
jgi:hypothetical protein